MGLRLDGWQRYEFWKYKKWFKPELRCFYCDVTLCTDFKKMYGPNRGTIDHLVPLANGGTSDESNLVECCYECNMEKGTMLPNHFLLFKARG